MSLRTLKNLPIWSLCLQFNHDILLCQGICDELNFQFLINLEEAFWAFSINLENNSLHHVWQIFWLHKFITKIRRSKIPDIIYTLKSTITITYSLEKSARADADKPQICFLNGPSPASFTFIFGLFQTNINTILQQINVKKCPSSIRHWDSNPRPSDRESPPITTRPGLPP